MSNKHELLVERLRDVHRSMGKFMKDILLNHGIPMSVFMATRQIRDNPGITVSELSRQTGLAKSHISNTVKELEQRGWVEKRPDAKDQRVLRLYLNDLAQQRLQAAGSEIRLRLAELVVDMPDAKAEALIAGLDDIKTALDRSRSVQCKPDCRGEFK